MLPLQSPDGLQFLLERCLEKRDDDLALHHRQSRAYTDRQIDNSEGVRGEVIYVRRLKG